MTDFPTIAPKMKKALLVALEPILAAADQADALGWRSDRDRDDYNEDAHLEVTITIKEARAVRDAIRMLQGKMPTPPSLICPACDYRPKAGDMLADEGICSACSVYGGVDIKLIPYKPQ